MCHWLSRFFSWLKCFMNSNLKREWMRNGNGERKRELEVKKDVKWASERVKEDGKIKITLGNGNVMILAVTLFWTCLARLKLTFPRLWKGKEIRFEEMKLMNFYWSRVESSRLLVCSADSPRKSFWSFFNQFLDYIEFFARSVFRLFSKLKRLSRLLFIKKLLLHNFMNLMKKTPSSVQPSIKSFVRINEAVNFKTIKKNVVQISVAERSGDFLKRAWFDSLLARHLWSLLSTQTTRHITHEVIKMLC